MALEDGGTELCDAKFHSAAKATTCNHVHVLVTNQSGSAGYHGARQRQKLRSAGSVHHKKLGNLGYSKQGQG
jgi:IS5 family transposase